MERDLCPTGMPPLAAFRGWALTVTLVILLAGLISASDVSARPWLIGKIVDANRARYLAMIQHSGHSSTTTNGSVSATGQSTTIGGNTSTNTNGSYSGTSSTNSSASDVPLYKVYENLVIEGDDMVYVTRERIRWRWSKGAHVTVNGEVKYYVDKRKLHVLDDDGKEHVVEIAEQIRKDKPTPDASKTGQLVPAATSVVPAQTEQALLRVSSTPDAADIGVDGNFVGNTPSDVRVTEGEHTVTVKKTGFKDWERKVKVTGGSSVHLNAELEKVANP